MRRPDPLPTWDQLVAHARTFGVEHLGVAPANVLERARAELHRRRDAGLHADMGFTYRDPDRSTDPARAVPGARCVIVAARPYLTDPGPDPTPPPGPHARVARFAREDHYEPLRAGLREMAKRLRASGERAVAFADDNSIVDREVAHLGGLGWFGKNANLLVSGAGSWFTLGCIVTTARYPVATPVADGCGTCRRCLDGCPTGAITAPGVVDANRCLAWILQRPGTIDPQWREVLHDRIYGCDDCQEVCPPTVHLGRRAVVEPGPDATAWVPVLDLLAADDETLLDRHGRWYLAGRDPRWLRRNALVVLGNVADPTDRRVRDTLHVHARGEDPILAEHARWALDRLDRRARGIPVHVASGGAVGSTASVQLGASADRRDRSPRPGT